MSAEFVRLPSTGVARTISASVVHVCDRKTSASVRGGQRDNVWWRPALERFEGKNGVRFKDGALVEVRTRRIHDNVLLFTSAISPSKDSISHFFRARSSTHHSIDSVSFKTQTRGCTQGVGTTRVLRHGRNRKFGYKRRASALCSSP